MQNITTLRYWCHKVIPLVYDDSLSYYELLGKVVGKLNEVIENTNEIPEYIKDTVLDMLKDSEAIEAILEEYLNDNNVELKSDLKSGTMPIEYMYQQTFSNSNYANAPSGASYYEVMQSMCFNNGLIYTCAYDRPEGINGRMRVYDAKTGAQVGSNASLSNCGHAQDCTTNGEYLFVTPARGETRVIWYNMNDFSVAGQQDLPVGSDGVSSIAYNKELDRFITCWTNKCFVWKFNKNASTKFTLERTVTLDDEPKADSTTYAKFPTMNRQGTCCYKNLIVKVYSFCGLICAFDLTTGKRVVTYNLPYKTDSGHSIIEPEGIDYDEANDCFYFSSFNNLDGTDYGSNTYRLGTNIFYKLNPFKNVIENYDNRAAEIEDYDIYVNGDYTGIVQNGNKSTPFKTIEQAIAMAQSIIGVHQGVRILLERGTDCGVLFGKNINNLSFDATGTAEDKPIISGVCLKNCSDIYIHNCRIKYRAGSYARTVNDEAVRYHAYIFNSKVLFFLCDFTEGNTLPDYGVYVTTGSDVKVTNAEVNADIGFYADAMSTLRTAAIEWGVDITKRYLIKNAHVVGGQEYANTTQSDFEGYAHPFDMVQVRYNEIDDQLSHDLYEGTFSASASNNVQLFGIELSFGNRTVIKFVPVHTYTNNILSWMFDLPSGTAATGLRSNFIAGTINLETKKIQITDRWKYDYSTGVLKTEGTDSADYVTITRVFII